MVLKQKIPLAKKANNILKKISGEKVVIGCSGGVDSMVLLDITRKAKSIQIIVAHVHHGLRETADRDQNIVQEYCKTHKIPLKIKKIKAKEDAKRAKMTIEEYARNVRRDFFEEISKKHKAKYILTAHHADDQVETLLYRITKGTSLTGLIGIEESVEKYIRPLINAGKKEIQAYAENNALLFGHDETNDDTTIPRNLLRHNVVPELRTINPEIATAITRLSHSARELKISFDSFFTEVIDKQTFTLDWYHTLPLGFQHELLRLLYESTNGSTHGLSAALIEELDRFLSTRNGGKKEIKKLSLKKKGGQVFIQKQ